MINWKVVEFINLILIVLLGSIYNIRNIDTLKFQSYAQNTYDFTT